MTDAVTLSIGGVHFDGFEPAFSDRAGAAFDATLRTMMTDPAIADRLEGATASALGQLIIDDLDFSRPEALGAGLARAIVAEVLR